MLIYTKDCAECGDCKAKFPRPVKSNIELLFTKKSKIFLRPSNLHVRAPGTYSFSFTHCVHGGEGEIRTLHVQYPLRIFYFDQRSRKIISQRLRISHVKCPTLHSSPCSLRSRRRGGDSNSRYLAVWRFSKPLVSTTHAPLRMWVFKTRE